MKSLFGWVSDPFFHIAVVVILVCLYLQSGGGAGAGNDPSAVKACHHCSQAHDQTVSCGTFAMTSTTR